MSLLHEYDRADMNRIHPAFLNFAELKREFEMRYPYFFSFPWFEKELHDLYMLGAPDPNPQHEGRRLILPRAMRKFAREVAERAGIEVMKHTKGA